MIGWLISEFGLYLLGAAGAVVAVAMAYLRGGSAEKSKAEAKDANGYRNTRERIDDAALGDNPSPDALRDSLRNRDPRKP